MKKESLLFSHGGRPGSKTFRKLKLDVYPPAYVAARVDELQIDLDSLASLKHFRKMIYRFKREWRKFGLLFIKKITLQQSTTKGHYHALVKLHFPLALTHRIFWQAVLGSDLTREMRNWCRAMRGMKDPVLLVVRKRQYE